MDDFAAARSAALESTEAVEVPAAASGTEQEPSEAIASSCLLVLGVLGCVVLAVLAVATGNPVALLVGVLLLAAAAVAVVRLYRHAGWLGRIAVVGLAGFVILVAGLMLGIQSYDERYFGNPAERGFWDAVSWVGLLLTVVGFFATAGALVTWLVAAIVWLVRGR
jgi:hypothetical protein